MTALILTARVFCRVYRMYDEVISVTQHPLCRLWPLSVLGRPYPIEISSTPDSEHSTQYYVEWNRPHTGGSPIKKYEFKLAKVGLLTAANNVRVAGVGWLMSKTTIWSGRIFFIGCYLGIFTRCLYCVMHFISPFQCICWELSILCSIVFVCMLTSGLHLSDLTKEATYLLTYLLEFWTCAQPAVTLNHHRDAAKFRIFEGAEVLPKFEGF